MYKKTVNTTEEYFIEKTDVFESDCNSLQIVMSGLNGNVGIGEIEVMTHQDDIPFREYLYNEKDKDTGKTCGLFNSLLLFEKAVFKLEKEIYYHNDRWIRKRKEYDMVKKDQSRNQIL